jgi:hypothetical protein
LVEVDPQHHYKSAWSYNNVKNISPLNVNKICLFTQL